MRVLKILSIVFMMCSLSVPAISQEEAPKLPDSAGDDTLVEVPIGYLRNALWYYDNYQVEKELREKYQEKYQVCSDSVDTYKEETVKLNTKVKEKENRIDTMRTIIIAIGSIFLIETGTDILVHSIK